MSTTTAEVAVSELDPTALSDHDAAGLAALVNAAEAVDAPHVDPVSGRNEKLRHAYGHDLEGTHGLFVAWSGDAMVGAVELHASRWDNPGVVFLSLQTHPEHRDRGVGEALLDRAVDRARAEGRIRLLGEAWLDSYQAGFWERHGFTVASIAANRRLVIAELDQARLTELLSEAEAASADYELVDLPNPAPEHLVPDLLAVHTAINDAPLDDLQIDDDQWPVERFHAYQQAMSARKIRLHRLLARRTSDGALGGHTVVCVEEDRPQVAWQEDTAVISSHRGHRLGLRLKVAMLRRLAASEPQLHHIDTWNAESNTHMIAVNDAIGCQVVGRGMVVQRDLD